MTTEQPYAYRARELVEPDWSRFAGWRDVTAEQWDSAQWQRAHCVKNVRQLRDVLVNATEWTSHDALEATVKSFCDAKGLGLGKVAQPLRVALSGTAVSPPIFDCLAFLGKEKTLARIDRCVDKVG